VGASISVLSPVLLIKIILAMSTNVS